MVALRDDQADNGGIGSTVPTYTTSTDVEFADGTTWAAAVCMVPWQLYTQYGDTQIIRENFDTMKAWLDGMDSFDFAANGNTSTGLSGKTTGLADWLSIDGNTTSDIVNNAIYIYMMEVTAIMADEIGETEYAQTLRAVSYTHLFRIYLRHFSNKTLGFRNTINHTVVTAIYSGLACQI